ncbi:MAG TPA: hypothetical protein VNW29_06560 [Candidatus Sulfotelmatobacter sp.]|jgi:hypothetical protein|nr:hypothetical protein [Candidatus Sulfotelmatobacter sp.]
MISTVSEADQQSIGQSQKITHKRSRNKEFFLLVGVTLTLLIFIPISILLFSNSFANKQSKTKPTPIPDQIKKAVQPTAPATKQQSQTLVYGTWTSQTSVIRSVDFASGNSTTIATLPLTIKKVSILSKNTLLYIDQTDTNDHGQRISVYNMNEKQIVTNIPADNSFGIDNYVLSSNKHYLVIWEVKFNPQTQSLQGGQSRVYAIDLTRPTVSNLLYDETATTTIPIHYPRAILNDGTVFTDQFIPNDPLGGTGWAYGMSTVDFDGTNKQDIATMNNGNYGSQPTLSPDGKYLLFAGYDGSNGDGTAIKNGYRQALLTPNTVELLDIKSLQRYTLPNLPDTNTYSEVQWDIQTGNVIISMLSQDAKQMGLYSYDLGKLQTRQIPLPTANGIQYGYISQLTDTKTLIGIQSNDAANLGNLGETYAYAYTQLATIDTNNTLAYLSLEDPFVQYITILPGNYFNSVLGVQTTIQNTQQPAVTYAILQGTTNTTPQKYSFFLKTTLASLRLQGKSTPIGTTNAISCQRLSYGRCGALGLTSNSTAFIVCQNIEKATNQTANACY